MSYFICIRYGQSILSTDLVCDIFSSNERRKSQCTSLPKILYYDQWLTLLYAINYKLIKHIWIFMEITNIQVQLAKKIWHFYIRSQIQCTHFASKAPICALLVICSWVFKQYTTTCLSFSFLYTYVYTSRFGRSNINTTNKPLFYLHLTFRLSYHKWNIFNKKFRKKIKYISTIYQW